ncbi:hypothetical protein C8J56DRAFT_965062 [Mycena floridula]|nr:hypothetical protein C8J56DRAFT_965062 [Mycena floridula]
MSEKRLSTLSVLFGGVGDARQLFGSLAGFHKEYTELDAQRQRWFKLHFTLLDLHPTALARDLCLLVLLEQLTTDISPEDAIEIKATIFYMWLGIIMPDYCENRFRVVVEDLVRIHREISQRKAIAYQPMTTDKSDDNRRYRSQSVIRAVPSLQSLYNICNHCGGS